MDIRQLRYFIAIVEHGTFSRAAEVLRIAQPALSLHVRNMEAELGASLLFRSSKGVTPTEAGQLLLHNARSILDQFAIMEETIRRQEEDPSGEVRLGLPGTISQILAVPLITAVRARYPKIKLRISDAMSGFVMNWLREGRIELAVLYNDAKEQGIQSTRLLEEKLVLFGSANDCNTNKKFGAIQSVAFRDVVGLPLILPGTGHALRDLLREIAEASGLKLATILDVDSYSNIKSLVEESIGCSVLPRNAIEREIVEGKLRSWTIHEPIVCRSVFLCHSAHRPMTSAVRAVRAIARSTLIQLVSDGHWTGAEVVVEPTVRRQ